MGADIGNPGKLQQPLYGAVLAVFPVQYRENHVNLLAHHRVAFKDQQALTPYRGDGRRAVVGVVLPGLPGQGVVVRAGVINPLALPGDAHGDDVIFFLVDIG